MTPPDGVRVERDITFARRPGGDLLLDLYRPVGDERVPVVVWLHGGGWFTGDRTLAPDLAERVAATGMAYASVEYRLSGEAIFPAQLFDVRAAIRHLRTEAASLGLDPDAIGVWGASAGGHLAALAGLTGGRPRLDGEEEDGDASVAAVAAGYPPVDLTTVVAHAETQRPGLDGASTPEARLLGGHPTTRPELAAQASPLTWVTADAPPFQLAHGTDDVLVPHEQSERLHERLAAAGVESELFLLDGYRHGFLNPPGRLDVQLARVMDDGRLVAEGRAAATRCSTENPQSTPSTFGFADVDTFFARHLFTDRGDAR